MKIYLMPGLGLSPMVFKNISFEGLDRKEMFWLEPNGFEAFDDYCDRLIKENEIPRDEEIILLGHSLGGIVIQEIARKRNVKLLVLISTVEHQDEFPFKLNLLKQLNLQKLFDKEWLERTFLIWRKFHDYESEEKKGLFHHSIELLSNDYFKWSIYQAVNWKQTEKHTNVLRLHGTQDSTFPIQKVKNNKTIQLDGGHLVVMDKGKEISDIIQNTLNQYSR